jgi:hypothetical protein
MLYMSVCSEQAGGSPSVARQALIRSSCTFMQRSWDFSFAFSFQLDSIGLASDAFFSGMLAFVEGEPCAQISW